MARPRVDRAIAQGTKHAYLFLTNAAAVALGLSEVGVAHGEEYPDAGRIEGRVVELGEPTLAQAPSTSASGASLPPHPGR